MLQHYYNSILLTIVGQRMVTRFSLNAMTCLEKGYAEWTGLLITERFINNKLGIFFGSFALVFSLCNNIPGHAWMLHLESCEESPGQGRPPFEGAGLVHSRVRVCSPPPQEAEHPIQACHVPQFPSTINKDATLKELAFCSRCFRFYTEQRITLQI